ncbi:MAG: 2OG-Fe(II) oxygenase [Alphaproteobacteria bacterium]|nr:2OG-Fe(II) oxygenase [Alphaproteobacteria bacterium]
MLERGFAAIGPLLDPTTCQSVSRWFDEDAWYRSHIDMARHGFGRGEYKYFADPLPRLVTALRQTLYGRLEPVANTWLEMLGRNDWFPKDHKAFVDRCHEAGQCHPTPLLLRYGVGDYNCLHQDLYGDHVFPLQVAIMLSEPGTDFSGGEFILTEQRPRMQSRVEVIPLGLGEAVVFAVNERPVIGKRGVYRVRMRHGVSRVLSGQRHVLGIIFHDAA